MANRQITAILLFTLAVLVLFILFIKGQNVWLFLHNCLFGLFGVLAYAVPVLIGYVAVLLALDKDEKSISVSVTEAVALEWFLCITIDIFTHTVDNIGFFSYVANAYTAGTALSGGGFFGALLGYPLSYLFGTVGARIISILLVFVLLMLITRTSLMSLFRKASKPVRDIKERIQSEPIFPENDTENTKTDIEDYDNIPVLSKPKKRSIFSSKPKNSKGARFNIDVPIGDCNANTDNTDTDSEVTPIDIDAKRDRLIDEYQGTTSTSSAKPENTASNASAVNDTVTSENTAVTEEKTSDTAKSADTTDTKEKKRRRNVNVDSVDDLPAAGLTVEVDADYKFPPLTLLNTTKADDSAKINGELQNKSDLLVNTLKSFGVETRLIGVSRGPSVTRYELQPAAGVKISKITGLANDIALNLASAGVRIEAPIPNKAAVGIEVPNKLRSSVGIRELLESAVYRNAKSKLCCVLGKDITGGIITMDLAKMPHLLVAGTTGSGKSVCLNSMIVSMLYKASPDEVILIMIDPKSVEFMCYNGIPHLLVPVVTNPQKAAGALGWAVNEMLKRYQLFSKHSVRNITGYNELCKIDDSLDPMPQIVIFIDELSDLMMAAPNEVEDSICRLAQMARAAGMHMVIATQSPRVDVITGLIKANIPSRIALTVSNAMDSRVIIDMAGAEKLIGYGDMLYFPTGMNKPLRVQGCFVSDEEINSIVDFMKKQGSENEYDEEIITEMEKQAAADKKSNDSSAEADDDCDERLNEAVEIVCREGQASTSFLQRKLKLGYARAARIMDEMQEKGVIGPSAGAKPRKLLITYNQWLERINGGSEMQEKLPGMDDSTAEVMDDYTDDEPPFDED